MLDGLANGLGYTFVLGAIGAVRELLGTGAILGYPILSAEWYVPNHLLILAPGAFFALGLFIAVMNLIHPREEVPSP